MSEYSQTIGALASSRPAKIEVRALQSVLLPGLCAVVFIVALFQVLFLSHGTEGLFRDSDTGWHIRNGEAILATHTTPTADPFSYTRPHAPWFAWEWLSDITLGYIHRSAGLEGVALLAGFTIALTAWGATRLALALGGNLFLAAGCAVLLLGATSIHWLARPHIFSWLLALAFVSAAECERRRSETGWSSLSNYSLYLLPVFACLWANMHGSFLLGPGILLTYAIGEWLKGTRSKAGLHFAAASLACLLATFINPYGRQLHEHIFAYLQNGYLMDHIAEYRSFNFHSPGALYAELFLLVAVIGALLMFRQRAFGPALLCFAMLHLALYSARHLPTAAVMLLPLCAAAITREVERLPNWCKVAAYSQRLRAIDNEVWGFVPIALALILSIAGVNVLAQAGRVGFSRERFPVRAVSFLETSGLQGQVFAKDQWGGYLIYRFSGARKVFIDGRSDFYGQDLLEAQAEIAELRPGWDSLLKQYDIQIVLVPPENALTSALQLSPSWKRRYSDSVAVVFERIS